MMEKKQKRKLIVMLIVLMLGVALIGYQFIKPKNQGKPEEITVMIQSIGKFTKTSQYVHKMADVIYYLDDNTVYQLDEQGTTKLLFQGIERMERIENCLYAIEDNGNQKSIVCEEGIEVIGDQYPYHEGYYVDFYIYDQNNLFFNNKTRELYEFDHGARIDSLYNQSGHYDLLVYYDGEKTITGNLYYNKKYIIEYLDEMQDIQFYDLDIEVDLKQEELCSLNNTVLNNKLYINSYLDGTRTNEVCSHRVAREKHLGSKLIEIDLDNLDHFVVYETGENQWIIAMDDYGYYTLSDDVLSYYQFGNQELLGSVKIEMLDIEKNIIVINVKEWLFIYNEDKLIYLERLNYER